MRIIISGGGSGGHIFPAIAVANGLKARVSNCEILFVGANGKMEMEKVPKAGYTIKGLNIRGLQRRITWKNLMLPFQVIGSFIKARSIVKQFKPRVVVGFGGYASWPTLKVANFLGIPTLLQEQNSYPGITNKNLAKGAKIICVAYDRMDRFFPNNKIMLTGNPVRSSISKGTEQRQSAIKHFGLDPNKATIFIMGGSLGARTINESLKSSVELLKMNPQIQIIWQAGKLYIESFKKTEAAQLDHVHITAFIDRMDLAYAAADLIISRAGALSISELCLVGKPLILVPSPNVAEDHQTKNAQALVDKNAALLVADKAANEILVKEAFDLIQDKATCNQMATALAEMGKPNATTEIVDHIIALAS